MNSYLQRLKSPEIQIYKLMLRFPSWPNKKKQQKSPEKPEHPKHLHLKLLINRYLEICFGNFSGELF